MEPYPVTRGWHRRYRWILLPLGLALLAGAPTIRGGFLPGDDVQLIRDHVLVNRPSLEHVIKLFLVPHRDLYQPVPLATFSLECGIMRALGLTPTADGPRPGAWVSHLGNILFHAANAALVFILLLRLSGSAAMATIAAGLFAIHPINVECIAWLNGRMMMLSTLFTLAAVLAAAELMDRESNGRAALVVVMAVLAMMSKISVGLPVLLLVVPWLRGRWPSRRWWLAFAGATAVTVAFIAMNVQLSHRQLETAGEALEGSRWARTVIALGWYLQHYLIPTGLAPWHPADAVVTFNDPRILPSALAIAGLLVAAGLATRGTGILPVKSRAGGPERDARAVHWSRSGIACLVWFFASIAATLPLVPTRNVLVAERYMYLPGVGLHWLVGLLAVAVLARMAKRAGARSAAALGGAAAVAAAIPLVILSWRHAADYRDNLARFRRIAALYPDRNEVWTRLAWALYDLDRYDEAIAAAEAEFREVPTPATSEVYQVQGMAHFRAGRLPEAFAKLHAAVAADPDDEMAYLRLATAQMESGRLEEAAANFRKSAELMPGYQHALLGLGQANRKLNRADDAAQAFAEVLARNPYEPTSTVALAETEIARGEHAAAAERLEKLLEWMPENAVAHANLGVCYLRSGRKSEAMREFKLALERDPAAVEPRVNLAALLAEAGRDREAAQEYVRAIELSAYQNEAALLAYCDFVIDRGDPQTAMLIWEGAASAHPENAGYAAWYAWSSTLAGEWELSSRLLSESAEPDGEPPAATLARLLMDVHGGRPDAALERLAALMAHESADARRMRARLATGLRVYSEHNERNPWPYYVMIALMKTEGRPDAARLALQAFESLNADEAWRRRARDLLGDLADSPPGPAPRTP